MMLGVTAGMPCNLVVYDCMDELANFLHAPAELRERERQLLRDAAVVFTGGQSLYESKRHQHPNVHAVPSSVDVAHFARARQVLTPPPDQAEIPHPRIGYCGVVDERIHLPLLDYVARRRPDWQLVMLGPVVKIDPQILPRLANIHYLGLKTYDELPHYLSGWDVAIMPFAQNASTRYISPTKTPEYLAAGKPVVSTPIADVVEPYGRLELVRIAKDLPGFVAQLEAALGKSTPDLAARRDAFLEAMSWDATWKRMDHLLEQARAVPLNARRARPTESGSHV
jgi:UDP-galactopyranose mutase